MHVHAVTTCAYCLPPDGLLPLMQIICIACRYLLKAVGLGFPLFHGTGLLFSPVGVLPYQSPIRIVVGAPIHAPHVEDVYSEEGKRYDTCFRHALLLLSPSGIEAL